MSKPYKLVARRERPDRSRVVIKGVEIGLNAVALLKPLTHLRVIVDLSHGTGRRELIAPISRAAVAAGADGLLVEVHPAPDCALSDGAQSIAPAAFSELMTNLAAVAPVHGRRLACGRGIDINRDRIDSIDRALIRLLSERARVAVEIGAAKWRRGEPLRSPERERIVLAQAIEMSAGALSAESAARLFGAIMAETRLMQESAAEVTCAR